MAHILIIDDDDQVSEMIAEVLGTAGHSSDRSVSAYGAMQKVAITRYDVILMDMLIQGANGIVAAMALRGMGYLGPIVAATGNMMQMPQNLYDMARFTGKLLKPFRSEELVAEIDRQMQMAAKSSDSVGITPMVLVVEDSQEYGAILTHALTGIGFNVDLVPNAEAALSMIHQTSYDVALVDIILPGGMSGIELAAAVRAEGIAVPMIAVSGMLTDAMPSLTEAGFVSTIDKTVGIKSLLDVVRSYVRR